MTLLLPLHIVFMSIALVLVVTAVIIAKKRAKKWLTFHKAFAISGVSSSLIAAACIVALKVANGYHHFQSPHAVAGLITLCLLIMTPVLGASIAKGPQPIRALHKLFGGITSIAIFLTAIMGVFRFLMLNKK